MKHILTCLSAFLLWILLIPFLQPVEAHITITPDEVGIGTSQIFTLSVPNEKDIPTTGVKLLIPKNVKHVTPTVKNGWQITTTSTGNTITAIEWAGGSIPANQRDEFSFSARTPDTTATLLWKTYQTYENGTVVSWDKQPATKSHNEKENTGPYATTLIIDDLHQPAPKSTSDETALPNLPLVLSVLAIILATISFLKKPTH